MKLAAQLDAIIDQTEFYGVVQVALQGCVPYERAVGYADRAHQIPNTRDTVFAIASGTKAFTALTVMSLVRDGAVLLDDQVHGRFGPVGALVEPGVTPRHLLAHTSGLGDYLDEDEIGDVDDYVLDIPVHRLTSPVEFLPLLRGRPAKFRPGTQFSYCNSSYVLLAVFIEEVCGCCYYDAVQQRVFQPAGMERTAFLRLDELPGSVAVGYLPSRGWRANHLHLPVRGGGDGGAYSTLDDIARFWRKLFAGAIVPLEMVAEMTRPQQPQSAGSRGHGLGLWLARDGRMVQLEGSDAGISFRSGFSPETGSLYTVISNTTSGAWPVVKELEATLSRC
jgi:CubicO group peptidase (beta-lactamase class C family)